MPKLTPTIHIVPYASHLGRLLVLSAIGFCRIVGVAYTDQHSYASHQINSDGAPSSLPGIPYWVFWCLRFTFSLGGAFASSQLGGHATLVSSPLRRCPLALYDFVVPEHLWRLSSILYFQRAALLFFCFFISWVCSHFHGFVLLRNIFWFCGAL